VKIESLKSFFLTALTLSFIFVVISPSFLVLAQSSLGSDVAFPGQNLQRTFFSSDSAPNSASLLWKFKMDAPPGVFSCVVVDGVVYQGCLGTGDIYAVNETTGEQIWHRNLNNTEESLTYYDGKIYTQGGSLPYNSELRTFGDLWIALDAKTGDTVWTYKIPQDEWILPNVGSFGNPPVIVDGKMYIEVYNGIATLDPNTGEEISRWTGVTPRSFFNAYYDGDILTVSAEVNQTDQSTKFYAVRGNVDSQTIVWKSHDNPVYPLGYSDVGQGFLSGIAVSGDVYVNEYNFTSADGPNRIYRIGVDSGTVVWAFTVEGYCLNVAAAYNNLYVGTTAGYVYSVTQAEGTTPIWREKYGSIVAPVAVADGKVFFGSENSYLYALDAYNGSLIWSFRAEGAVESEPVIANNKLFIASRDNSSGGYLYAFGTPPPKPSSKISLSNSQTVNPGQSVLLSGKLTDESGKGVADAVITLQQRIIPRVDWSNITTVTTDSDGNYVATWTPPIDANYDLNATYYGGDLAPSSSVSLIQVSAPTINVNALATYLIAIIVLELLIVIGIVWIVMVYVRKK
jgi:outer membrane protein assembly factor BamB